MKPTFIIAGAQKAGTDSLYGYLDDHPDAVMADPKEPHYFSKVPAAVDRAAYQRSFAERPGARAFGEASTSYMPVRWTADRIRAEAGPGVRLVFVLRNPVERIYSAFLNMKRARPLRDARAFDEAVPWQTGSLTGVLREEAVRLADAVRRRRVDLGPFRDFGDEIDWNYRYVANSVYRPQIERFLRHFPRAQCLFLTTDDLRTDWRGAAAALYRFLDLDPGWVERLSRPQRNRASLPRPGPIGRLLSYRVIRDAVRPVLLRGGSDRMKSWVKRIATTTEFPPLAADARAGLVDVFAEENEALAELIGRDLTAWNARVRADARG
ncbi:MAG: sulfotransferase domain-containing protein [Candidatus Rokubacteria bacterium]|nr:sulfotransferase domain-containing protein [Candidatus Rokubacteria bacterium]